VRDKAAGIGSDLYVGVMGPSALPIIPFVVGMPERSCLLRTWRHDDADALRDGWADPEVARWNEVPADTSLGAAQRWIAGVETRAANRIALDLAIEVDQQVIGEVGISGINTERRAGLVGYWVRARGRRQGVAGAALRALSTWALSDGEFSILVARCDSANLASQRTAATAGFVHEVDEAQGRELWVRRASS